MGKPSQTRKERKYLKAGDLVETVKSMYGRPVETKRASYEMMHVPTIGCVGLILSVKRMTKRDHQSECVILFGEQKFRFEGVYWEAFKRIERE